MGACISSNYCNRNLHNVSNRRQQSSSTNSLSNNANNNAANINTQTLSQNLNNTQDVNNNIANSDSAENTNAANNNNTIKSNDDRPTALSNLTNNTPNITANTQNNTNNTNSSNNNTNNNNSNSPNNNSNYNNYLLNHINSYSSYAYYVPPTGKNKRLKKDFYKYFKCEKRISEAQLQAKRDEFWDTAPAFEGKVEIWTALKAAVEACEQKNFILAQAIIDSANIILPNGLLNDCYDELGTRYQIPIYVLAKPANLVKPKRSSKKNIEGDDDSSSSKKKKRSDCNESDDDNDESEDDLDDIDNDDDFNDYDDDEENCKSKSKNRHRRKNFDEDSGERNSKKTAKSDKKPKKFKFSKSFLSNSSNNIKPTTSNKCLNEQKGDSKSNNNDKTEIESEKKVNSYNELFQVKLRVSSLSNEDEDIKLNVFLNQTVLSIKIQLKELVNIDPACQRFYFGGRLMRDKDKLKSHKIHKNVVIQVIIREKQEQNKPAEEKVVDLENTANQTVVQESLVINQPTAENSGEQRNQAEEIKAQ